MPQMAGRRKKDYCEKKRSKEGRKEIKETKFLIGFKIKVRRKLARQKVGEMQAR